MFSWYWVADLCEGEGIPFVLGHALYMRAIHGGKAKNDRIDSYKIAVLLRGGTFPVAYVYPAQMRATRDALRRRSHFMRERGELLAHIQNTTTQYNLPALGKSVARKRNREGVAERFPEPSVRQSIEANLKLIAQYDVVIGQLEQHVLETARVHDPQALYLLRSIPGVGKILSLVLLYEIQDIGRFPTVQDFVSYCRLVKCAKESAGKSHGFSGTKIGNAHLKWAFSEAAVLFLKGNTEAQRYYQKLKHKHGEGKALSVLAHKLGRAVFHMLRRKQTFDVGLFLNKTRKVMGEPGA